MDPLSLAAIGAVLVVALLVGSIAALWMVRTTVRLMKRLLALAFVLAVGTGLVIAAIVMFSYGS